MQTVQVVLATVLMFFLLVSLHEWGHYYFARRAGILVREFAIGFGPKLFSVKRGETRYTIRLLPIGGFVRMAGEDPETVEILPGQTVALRLRDDRVTRVYLDRLDERSDVLRGEVKAIDLERDLYVQLDVDGDVQRLNVHPQALVVARGRDTQIAPVDRQFGNKTVGQRAIAIFSGPVMNFLLAFFLFGIFLQSTGLPIQVIINNVVAQSPAQEAGLQNGDVVKSVNGQPVGGDLDAFTRMIRESSGTQMSWVVERGGNEVPLQVTPGSDGKVGIYPGPGPERRTAGAGETLAFAGESMVNWTKVIFDGFRKIIFGEVGLKDMSGPVGTTKVTMEIARSGLPNLVHWAAILSLYLGIFNLLPIPALDGSRLLFLGIEAVRGRPIDPNRESMVHFIGFAMLMLLMVVVTYNDILGLVTK
jgi:regulator of sigma E protease